MTADPVTARRAGREVDVHLFLLAGRRSGGTHAAALADAHQYGRAAEAAGYAGVWMAEHHFISYGVCPSAVTFAAHLLGSTRSIAVGTAACILSNRHPVALGEEAVLLDELSGGRFRLGVGRGGPWVDLEVFGVGLDHFHAGFHDALELLGRWLSGAPTVAGNDRFPFRPVPVVPRPTRRIPVWIAATSPQTVDLAARHGMPLLLGLHADLAEKASLLDRYAQVAAVHGHDGHRIGHASAHLAHVGDSDARAADEIRAGLPALLAGTREYVRLDGTPARHRDLAGYVERLITVHPVGSPRRCGEILDQAATLPGVRHLLLMVEGAGGRDRTIGTVHRIAADVLGLSAEAPSPRA
ncbi:LLM class flavin-dependent oxidoreductase [Micromonospora sp. WMMA1363]|uniref:LLM class flavin-dependent oxidoreductase n=1 Tax=Micromonospora sp. WMMA1363 TaxID=3053985 RepID=UPI00259C69C8|nr:LLM class flavin-dependent oxidoreductase [Micromonospora sp. WMMA1363]MDM4721199.1 LLM class flavin-dependent oxidoreductase [Micromonospora sp. WMMA1363]